MKDCSFRRDVHRFKDRLVHMLSWHLHHHLHVAVVRVLPRNSELMLNSELMCEEVRTLGNKFNSELTELHFDSGLGPAVTRSLSHRNHRRNLESGLNHRVRVHPELMTRIQVMMVKSGQTCSCYLPKQVTRRPTSCQQPAKCHRDCALSGLKWSCWL
jgi:hypothetical protein